MDREEIAQSCADQAGWAAKLGSPMYEALLHRMADEVRAGGPADVAALWPYFLNAVSDAELPVNVQVGGA